MQRKDKMENQYSDDNDGAYTLHHSKKINLDNMKSVMHSGKSQEKEINEIRKYLEKLSTSHNNLLRENQTLRKRNANLEKSNRNLENRLSEVERNQESLTFALNEVVNIIDKNNKNGIIDGKRRK